MYRAMKCFTYLAMTLIVVFFSGCSHKFVAKQYPIEEGMAPALSCDKPIKITNAQGETKEVLLGTNGGHKFYGSLRQITDIAIDTIKTEFGKHGIQVRENAEKELMISVTKVHFKLGFTTFSCDTEIVVNTGDGYTGLFDGHDTSGVVPVVMNGAINHAVVAALNDEHIAAYLKQ